MPKHLAEQDAQQGKPRAYVTLDGTILRMAAKEELELFLQRYRPPVLTRKARGRFLFGRSRSRTPPMPGCVQSCDPLHRSTSLQRQSSRSFRSSHIATATPLFIVWHSIAHPHGLCPPSVAQRKSGYALYCTAGFRPLCGDECRGNGVRRGRSSARGRAAQAFFGKSCVQTAMMREDAAGFRCIRGIRALHCKSSLSKAPCSRGSGNANAKESRPERACWRRKPASVDLQLLKTDAHCGGDADRETAPAGSEGGNATRYVPQWCL